MKILDITLKDLTQILRDKRSLLFLVAMPIVFTLFMGFAYNSGSNSKSNSDRSIPLGWVNQDPGGLISTRLQDLLSQSDALKLVELSPELASESVAKGDVAGTLIIPAGYSELVKTGAGQLTLIADLNTPQGQTLLQSLRTPVTQLLSSAEIARLSAETIGNSDEFIPSFAAASQAWDETNTTRLVNLEMAVAEPEQAWYGDNPFNQASPGILVQFAIFGLVTSGQILVQERKTRTLQRMISTSLRSWQIVSGHLLAMFALVFMQEILLVIFGQLALGVNYLREPLGVLLISVALGLWIATMGLLIGVLVKNDSQVILFSLIAMFIFSALGGTWFPLEVSGGAFAFIGRLMPSAWAMVGYQNILIRGLNLGSAWVPALVLLAYAGFFFGLAVWQFKRHMEA